MIQKCNFYTLVDFVSTKVDTKFDRNTTFVIVYAVKFNQDLIKFDQIMLSLVQGTRLSIPPAKPAVVF